jgi:hypothetical protein
MKMQMQVLEQQFDEMHNSVHNMLACFDICTPF